MFRKGLLFCLVFIIASAPVGAATNEPPKQLRKILQMSVEDISRKISVSDDELDTVAKLTSQPIFQHKKGLLGIVWEDNFLRAFIDKKTGNSTFQIYQSISYQGDWRWYNRVNYSTPNGPVSTELTPIASDVLSCSGSRYSGGCRMIEEFGFEVPESLLRTIANGYQPGQVAAWRFKYKAKSFGDWQDGILPLEVAGFMKAVDKFREERGLTGRSTPASPAATSPEQ